MALLDTFGEWLYANTSTEYKDNAQTHQDVAAGQSQRYNDLTAQGKINPIENLFYQADIQAVGNETAAARDAQGSGWNLLKGTWFIWLPLLLVAFWWLGGFVWVKNKLAK